MNDPRWTVFAVSALFLASAAQAASVPVVDADGADLGAVELLSSCTEEAQGELRRGLALLHHMNYVKAAPAFEAATAADAECALGYWGVAMSWVHPLWPDRISADALAGGRDLLTRAQAAANASPREAAYVAALAGYYAGDDRSERERLGSLLEGWTAAHAAHPDDPEAAAFHALSLLATAEAADKSYTKQVEAGEILEGVLAAVPRHPGAHHYTIHAYDFPPLAERALPVVRSYGDLAPENTHALHMTSHIFTRLGLWPESIAYNERAAAASSERTPGGAVSLHHFHAYDYLAYAHLQRADDEAAADVLARLEALEPPFQDHAATTYALAAVPARLALERHDWERAADIDSPTEAGLQWDRYPYLEAITWFSRAMGAARTGHPDAAREAIGELTRLETAARELDIAYDWATQVAVQRVAAESWTAFESGDVDTGLDLARRAAEMEAATEKNPVTPGEVLPAQELYGDMLLAADRAADALTAYAAALDRSPNRYNSLAGAMRAAERAGDDAIAAEYAGRLLEVCPTPSGEHPDLDHARRLVG